MHTFDGLQINLLSQFDLVESSFGFMMDAQNLDVSKSIHTNLIVQRKRNIPEKEPKKIADFIKMQTSSTLGANLKNVTMEDFIFDDEQTGILSTYTFVNPQTNTEIVQFQTIRVDGEISTGAVLTTEKALLNETNTQEFIRKLASIIPSL